MQITFESRSAEGKPLREPFLARLRFALRRLQALAPRVKLQLSDVNGPRGGIDKRCQLTLQTNAWGALTLRAQADTWRAALELALLRAIRALTRQLKRSQQRPRGPAVQPA